MQKILHILLADLAATQRFGAALGANIEHEALIALQGPLGAGKTTLVKAVGKALGVTEVIVSPTFTMLNEYHSGRLPFFHLDIYRGGETGETMDLEMLAMEMDELLAGDGIAMIEWPQYFLCDGRSFFDGRDFLHISLEPAKDENIEKKRANDDAEKSGAQASTKFPENRLIGQVESQAVDNQPSEQTFARVLREDSPPEKYIKDGFTQSRIATLSADGQKSRALLVKLSGELGDMVINL